MKNFILRKLNSNCIIEPLFLSLATSKNIYSKKKILKIKDSLTNYEVCNKLRCDWIFLKAGAFLRFQSHDFFFPSQKADFSQDYIIIWTLVSVQPKNFENYD